MSSKIIKPELICLDLIDTLVLRNNSQFTVFFVEQLNKFNITVQDTTKVAKRIREKYLEYSFGNYSDDIEYLRSITRYYLDFPEADDLVYALIPGLFEHFALIDNCKEFLEFCASKYKLVLASNFIVSWAEHLLDKFDIRRYFEKIYISSEIRYRKPAKEFYLQIINDYPHIEKNKMLMIGDSIVNDFYGAKDLGLSSILFDNGKTGDYYHKNIRQTFLQIEQSI